MPFGGTRDVPGGGFVSGGFTPGPWEIHAMGANDTARFVDGEAWQYDQRNIGKGDVLIGTVDWNTACNGGYPAVGSRDEMLANASLIAAAPDLLEALERMLDEFDADEFGAEGQMRTCAQARAAIVKAVVS